MYTFAYGSNMDPVQMASRCPGAKPVGAAHLPGHRVIFVKDIGGFDGGVATIIPDPSQAVWGVLWKITGVHLKALDEWEGYPDAYDRSMMPVEGRDAIVYVSRSEHPEPPAQAYLDGILRGAREHDLPQEYVDNLARWTA